jgi:hypothetical protein
LLLYLLQNLGEKEVFGFKMLVLRSSLLFVLGFLSYLSDYLFLSDFILPYYPKTNAKLNLELEIPQAHLCLVE